MSFFHGTSAQPAWWFIAGASYEQIMETLASEQARTLVHSPLDAPETFAHRAFHAATFQCYPGTDAEYLDEDLVRCDSRISDRVIEVLRACGLNVYAVPASGGTDQPDRELRSRRGPGRPRREYAVQRLTIELPVKLLIALDSATANRTAFIEQAVRLALDAGEQPIARLSIGEQVIYDSGNEDAPED